MHIVQQFFSRFHESRPNASTPSDKNVRETEGKARSFRRDESGAIAIIFVVSLIPIIMMLGAAVDYARVALARSEAQDALDAATLAAVKQIGTLSDSDITSMINAYVAANGPSDSKVIIDKTEISDDPTSIQAWATGTTDMTFMRFAGINTIDFSITSKSVAGNKTLEVVMVLDNSGSMASSAGSKTRIQALRDAATELVELLDEKKQDEESLSFGLVPFTQMVRLNEDAQDAEWLDKNGVSSIHQYNLPSKANRFDLFDTLTDPYTKQAVEWDGCVEARPHPLDIKDTTPSSATPDSYFVPFFHPDRREPNNNKSSSWSNDYYLPRNGYANGQTYAEKQAYGYYFEQTIRKSGYGPNYWCDMQRMVPLTNDTNTIKSKINSMVANGATNIHMGTIWGLRMLSPQAPYTEGRAYDDEENIKALIIMTDGNNTYYNSYYHAYGWYDDGRISGSGSIVSEMNTRTSEACQAAKDAVSDSSRKIKIFTIYFGSPSSSTTSMLKGCASKDEWYKSVSNASELSNVFKNIASELSNLRLVK
ncbi:pilus assembly protein TadG-related protein [uncultured Cohaesibacter sp.]|uniref:TadE/TadG family type IV pilus assembly protein n=1 Tax=uncultured Cohaesibacter sp. TaxID=1002546 RepID=UPI0029C7F1AC|nr:pilus assembly protein TadG-related protein [uncultured Cohaesibacter sp.]